ncbi:MAG: hypothetical protein RML45_16235 [Acetobacteraceae bacterium]|nr:hypothetical protein [Acetobacteraceae bacterium]
MADGQLGAARSHVSTLFQAIAQAKKLRPLGLVEPLSRAAEALARVDRNAFFRAFSDAEAVRYFYEPFLAAFDPDLRKVLGVWFTPREIVRSMVERVDRVLRPELGLADGPAGRTCGCSTPAAAPAPTWSRCWGGAGARLRRGANRRCSPRT